jgi:hypothetical protein
MKFKTLLLIQLATTMYAQLPVTGIIQTNTMSGQGYNIKNPDVSVSPAGAFSITWDHPAVGTPSNHNNFVVSKVRERNYSAANVSSTPAELFVYNGFLDYDGDYETEVAMKNNGDYFVAYWEVTGSVDYNGSGNTINNNIYYQKYASNGGVIGPRIFVDAGKSPSIDIASDGTYNICYFKMINGSNKICIKRYNSIGTLLGGTPTFTDLGATGADIRSLPGNTFDIFDQGIYRVNSAGAQVYGTLFFFDSHGPGWDKFIVKPSGDIVGLNTSSTDISIDRYHATSNTTYMPREYLIVNNALDPVLTPSIGSNDNGDYVVVSPKYDPATNNYLGMFAQQYCSDDSKIGPSYSITDGFATPLNNMKYVSIDVSDCEFVVSWTDPATYNTYHRKFKLYPKYTVVNNYTICQGSGVRFTNTELCSASGYAYSWAPASSLMNANTLNPTAIPTVTTTYTLTAVTPCGTYTNAVTVSVNPLPAVNAGPDQTICAGNCVTIGTNMGNTPFVTYNWTPNTGLSCNACQTPTACPSVTTTYTLTVTNTRSGCISTDYVTITVTPVSVLDPDFNISCTNLNNDLYCEVSATVSNPIPAGSGYDWYVEQIDAMGVTVPGSQLNNPSGWWSNPYGPLAFPGFNHSSANSFLHDASGQFPSPGVFRPGYIYKVTRGVWADCTPYTSISHTFGCTTNLAPKKSGDEAERFVNLSEAAKPDWNISPVPSNGIFDLSLNEKEAMNVHVVVRNATGTIIFTKDILHEGGNKTYSIELADVSSGIYVVEILSGGKHDTKRMIIARD